MQRLAPTESCGEDFYSLTTRCTKKCLVFALQLPRVGLIKGLVLALKEAMKSQPVLTLLWFYKPPSSLLLLISFSSLKNPGMLFNSEFQPAETRADVFMVCPKPRSSSGPSF